MLSRFEGSNPFLPASRSSFSLPFSSFDVLRRWCEPFCALWRGRVETPNRGDAEPPRRALSHLFRSDNLLWLHARSVWRWSSGQGKPRSALWSCHLRGGPVWRIRLSVMGSAGWDVSQIARLRSGPGARGTGALPYGARARRCLPQWSQALRAQPYGQIMKPVINAGLGLDRWRIRAAPSIPLPGDQFSLGTSFFPLYLHPMAE